MMLWLARTQGRMEFQKLKKTYTTLSSRRTKRCQVLLFFYEALLSQKRSCLGSIGILDRIKHEDGRYIFL